MTFTEKEAREIVYDDHADYKVLKSDIYGTSRWAIYYRVIVQQISTGKYFRTNYSRGATEHQDHMPYEYDEPILIEVEPFEKTIIDYRDIRNV